MGARGSFVSLSVIVRVEDSDGRMRDEKCIITEDRRGEEELVPVISIQV